MLHIDSFPIDTGAPPARPATPLPDDAHVLVPEEVDVPLPRDTMEQIVVPASVNGRDLSRGKP